MPARWRHRELKKGLERVQRKEILSSSVSCESCRDHATQRALQDGVGARCDGQLTELSKNVSRQQSESPSAAWLTRARNGNGEHITQSDACAVVRGRAAGSVCRRRDGAEHQVEESRVAEHLNEDGGSGGGGGSSGGGGGSSGDGGGGGGGGGCGVDNAARTASDIDSSVRECEKVTAKRGLHNQCACDGGGGGGGGVWAGGRVGECDCGRV
jgi:hypothetical protein